MGTRFLAEDVWKRIRALKKKPGQRLVAVPFLGENASRRLNLRSGDLLVVRLDLGTVKSGQTSPREIGKYLRKGVEVHSQANLHAKVFVFGNTCIIGSANISASSEERLVEAAVETTAASVVASAKRFVRSLRGDVVTPDEVRRLERILRPPRSGQPGRRRTTAARLRGSGHSTVWAVSLETGGWDEDDFKAERAGTPLARRKLKNTRYFTVDDFRWDGGGFSEKVRLGQRVVRVTEEDEDRVLVSAPAKVVRKHVYRSARGTRRVLIFLETRKAQRRKTLGAVLSRLGPPGKALKNLRGAKQLKDPALLYQLGQLWESEEGR